MDLIEELLQSEELKTQKCAIEGLEDMKILFRYLDLYGVSDRVSVGAVTKQTCLTNVNVVFSIEPRH